MLIASTKGGESISLASSKLSREALKALEKHYGFYCPVCRAPLLFKSGEKRRWHFAHQSHHACLVDNEPETAAHLSGKEDLLHWCEDAGRSPRLEFYLPALCQRPDVYLPGIEPTALEYQCSLISEQRFAARSKGYLDAHINPVWIIGAKHYHGHRDKIRLSGFTSMAIRQSRASPGAHPFASSYYVCFYDPSAKRFSYSYCLSPISKTHFISQESCVALSECRPYQLLAPTFVFLSDSFICSWLTMKKRARLAVTQHRTREEYALRALAYGLRQHFAYFPGYVGLPHHAFVHFVNPPLLWQMWLFLLMGISAPGHRFTPRRIIHEAVIRGLGSLFMLRSLPLCTIKTVEQLVTIYLEQLVRLRIAEKSSGSYRIKQLPKREESISALLNEDRVMLKRLEMALYADPIHE
ncbi:competence protein CoiA family protein [Sporolactobacillus sp. STCC-11]|uniref:competence protein CoiA n=1 Tax=Sporolactobacillus caesalpiniae TaxID=3230362 RepID=UPI0033998916